MKTQAYRLTMTSRSASTGTVEEAVVISAEDADEAAELARSYVDAVGTEALSSAILTDASGTVIWQGGSQDRGNDGPLRNGGPA